MISTLKFSSYQRKVYTLALILGLFIFVLPSCTEEVAPSQSIEIKKAGFEKFSIEDLPAMANAIAPFVNPNFEQKVDGKLTVSPQNESELSKALNYDEVLARYDGKGNTNYAMAVADNDDNPFSFSNFIIMQDSTGAFRTPFVLTYEMADDFIEEYLVDKDISKFRGKITQYDLGPMDAQRVDSRNPGTNDPEPGSGGSTGTPPTRDGNVVCEKDYAGSGGTSTGSGGYNTEVCDYYLVTVYDHSTNGTKNVWYTYISEENCRIVWIAEQAAAGTTTCPSGTGDGEIPVIEPSIWSSDLIILQDSEAIENIVEYLKCFDSNVGGTVSIYVDQPVNNSPATHVGTEVGHTFISVNQGGVTRFFGFYPNGGVYPLVRPGAESILGNDSNHPYDVKIDINVNSSEMASVLNAARAFGNTRYHLNTYNCTDFGFTISSAAGVILPDTNGSWPGGGGSNPGNLGQDLRTMPTNSKYSVSTVPGTASSNSGNCR
uniref:hypothetical protein n=3 Tax=Roseivirga sp. TaxID=1964215 RepID=UPI0040474788